MKISTWEIEPLRFLAGIAAALIVSLGGAQAGNLKDLEITDEFPLERCINELTTRCVGDDCNQYLPLIVRRVWELDNSGCDDCDEFEQVRVSVLNDTEMINYESYSVRTRVYEEREWIDGEFTEVTRNFVNQCGNTQDIYYWGEEVCVPEGSDAAEDPPFPYSCEEGLVPGGGAWKAGVDGAAPGILFQGGAFLLGARYYQELAINALDWAENAEMGLAVDDPANGEFEDCVLVLDRNAIEDPMGKEADEKVYCPDIGIVRDEDLELVSCSDPMGACSQ